MDSALGLWMEDNAELFKYVSELPAISGKSDRILLSGGASALLAGVFGILCPEADIVAVDSNMDILADASSECGSLNIINSPFDAYLADESYDLIVSALQIQSLNTRELTPYLFNLYDNLGKGGALYLSFPDAVAPTVMEKNLYPSWYSMYEEVYLKYYMSDDVVNALSLIGFEIKAIEADNNEDLGHVVSLLCVKR